MLGFVSYKDVSLIDTIIDDIVTTFPFLLGLSKAGYSESP